MVETRDKFIFGNYIPEMFEYFVFSFVFLLLFGFMEIENLYMKLTCVQHLFGAYANANQ